MQTLSIDPINGHVLELLDLAHRIEPVQAGQRGVELGGEAETTGVGHGRILPDGSVVSTAFLPAGSWAPHYAVNAP